MRHAVTELDVYYCCSVAIRASSVGCCCCAARRPGVAIRVRAGMTARVCFEDAEVGRRSELRGSAVAADLVAARVPVSCV